jgi:hypothetical protein
MQNVSPVRLGPRDEGLVERCTQCSDECESFMLNSIFFDMGIDEFTKFGENFVVRNCILVGENGGVQDRKSLFNEHILIFNVRVDNTVVFNHHVLYELDDHIPLVRVHDDVHDDRNQFLVDLDLLIVKFDAIVAVEFHCSGQEYRRVIADRLWVFL